MLEKVAGVNIKGKYFSEESRLDFFQQPKDRISMVFGRNGSGKSTITEGFRAYVQNCTEELSFSLIDGCVTFLHR